MILKPGKLNVLVISDLQIPFHHKDAFEFLQWIVKEYGPFDEVVCIGDEIDNHALSSYEHNPDGYSAGHELEYALSFLHELYIIFPTVKVVTSNHTARPFRQAYKHGIPRAFLKDYKEFLQAPEGWEWRDHWIVDGVYYFHGEGVGGVSPALNAVRKYMRPIVFGHTHAGAGIHYLASSTELMFGFDVGCLIDNDTYAFEYGKHFANKPIIGTGIILKGVPQFIPMLLDEEGRWLGRQKSNIRVVAPKKKNLPKRAIKLAVESVKEMRETGKSSISCPKCHTVRFVRHNGTRWVKSKSHTVRKYHCRACNIGYIGGVVT
jgi:hypothetical protein